MILGTVIFLGVGLPVLMGVGGYFAAIAGGLAFGMELAIGFCVAMIGGVII